MSIKSWDPSVEPFVRRLMEELIPFNRLLGIKVVKLDEGFAHLELPFKPELVGDPTRPAIHGGCLGTLIDTAAGAATFTLIMPPETCSTIDMRIDYLRPGESKTLHCEARVTRMGNRVASVDSKVYHPDAPDRLVCTGKGVYNVKRAKDA
jgi:uncharacterized protein (TIGR00369 family)